MTKMTFEIYDMPKDLKTDGYYMSINYPKAGIYGPVVTSIGPQYFIVTKDLNGVVYGIPKSSFENIQILEKAAPVENLEFATSGFFPAQHITAKDMIMMAAVSQNPELVKYLAAGV